MSELRSQQQLEEERRHGPGLGGDWSRPPGDLDTIPQEN